MQQIYRKCFFTILQFSSKVKATISQMNMMNYKIGNHVIRIPAALFKTGYMQSPYKNSAKFSHSKPKHCFKLSARRVSCYFLRKYNAESASFNLESSPIVAQSTFIYLSASHKGQQKLISTETAFQLFPQIHFRVCTLLASWPTRSQIPRPLQHFQKTAEGTLNAR